MHRRPEMMMERYLDCRQLILFFQHPPLLYFLHKSKLMSRLLVSTKDFLFFFLFKCMFLFPVV